MDIYNTARIAWQNMDEATKAEIVRQQSLGAACEFLGGSGCWNRANSNLSDWRLGIYRIKPGTAIYYRPADETDLTQLCKPVMALHPETVAALKAWKHGWEALSSVGVWYSPKEPPLWLFGSCYRAKTAPSLIERITTGQLYQSDHFVKALLAAHAFIKTIQGGDPALRKAYEEAIK